MNKLYSNRFLFFCFLFLQVIGTLNASAASISGRVIDRSKSPLEYVLVYLKENTKHQVMTDVDGRFELKGVSNGKYTLCVSMVGYKPIEQVLNKVKNHVVVPDIILDDDMQTIGEVVVSAKSKETLINTQAFAVEAISTTGLSARNVELNKLLNKSTGISVRESGGLGSGVSYSINGMSGRSIRFFVDGVPIEQYGSGYNINNFPVNLIERVEIYKGATPSSLASDALGGAINIITKNSVKSYIDASYSYGSYNTHRASASGHWQNKSGIYTDLQAFYNYSDNNYKVWGQGVEVADPETGRPIPVKVKRFHDAYHSYSGKALIGVKNKAWADDFFISLLYTNSYNELQHGATMAKVYGEALQRSNSLTPTLSYRKKDLFTENLNVNLFSSYSMIEDLVVDTCSRTYNWLGEVIDEHPLNSEIGRGKNGKSLLTMNSKSTFVKALFDYTFSDIHRFDLSYALDNTNRKGDDPLGGDRTVALRENQHIQKNVVSLGYSLDAFNEKWNNNVWAKYYDVNAQTVNIENSQGIPEAIPVDIKSSSMGYGYAGKYEIDDVHLMKFSIEQASRLPSARELLGDGLFVSSNPDLRPEQSLNVNLGYMASHMNIGYKSSLSLQFDVFYRDTKDLILYNVTGLSSSGQYVNIGKVRGLGGSAEVSYFWNDMLRVTANVSYNEMRDNNRKASDGYNANQTYQDRIPNTPYLNSNFTANFSKPNLFSKRDRIMAYWEVKYVHEFYLTWASLGSKDTKVTIPTQFVNDIGVSYSILDGKYNFGIDCSNLFNEQLYDNYMLQKPGRFISAKFSIHLGY